MAIAVRLPKLGKAMEEGTIVNAMIKIGDKVSKGDIIFEVETDKATLEVESPESGFVKHILIGDCETVAVNTPLAVFGTEEEIVCADLLKELTAEKDALRKEIEYIHTHDTEIRQVNNSDICSSLADGDWPDESTCRPGKTIPLGRLQKLLGDRMVQSKRHIPCFYLTIKVDVTEIAELIEKMNTQKDANVIIDDFVMLAMAQCLVRYPEMTGQISGENIVLSDEIGIGLVMEVPGGAVAPVIKNVDNKTVIAIAAERADLAKKAANKKLTLEDLQGACITLSNMGPCGVEMFIPVVIPGQCSIVGLGRSTETCVPHKKNVEIRKIMKMSISVDHRVANGASAGQFLDYIKKTLEAADNFS
ncbi:MAG: 2-oxo acid dehydrogenase subunit E2 [Phycisphaerae bacterium]|nr:2-oxo acid dehydrogenase subunit E2 [Phycisphaerae bacterium]